MKTLQHTVVQKHVEQVLQPSMKSYTFKRKKKDSDEYEFKTVESTSSMTAWAIVGYEFILVSIDKQL